MAQPLPTPQTATEALAPLYAICISFLVLNTVFVIARFFTVMVLRKAKVGLWWDDFWIIPSYLCNIALIVIAFKWRSIYINEAQLTGNQPLDPHTNKLHYPPLSHMLKLVYILVNFLIPVFFTTRASILLLYLRIFSGRKVRLAIYGVGALCLLQWVAVQIVSICLCLPIHKFWDRIPDTGKCVDINGFFRGISYPTLIFDAFLIVLPLPTVWQLRASTLRKTAISAMFLTSVLALMASAYRTYVVQTHDASVFTPALTNQWMSWIIGETGVYLIVACLPALAPLFRAMIPPSLRQRGNHAFHAAGRYIEPTSSHANGSQRGDFTRLVDSDATAQAVAESKDGRLTPGAIELGDRSKTPNSQVRESDVHGFEQGKNVLVHTEIIVTTEEKIEQVLGI